MTEPSGPLRVIHLIDDLTIGGAQQLVVRLSGDLVRRGDEAAVFARRDGPLWDDLDPRVRRLRFPVTGRLRTAVSVLARLRRTARRQGVHVVHAHGRLLAIVARIATAGLRTVVVEHVHSTFAPTPLARLLSFRGAHLIACGSAVRAMLLEQFGRPDAAVRLIPNGVPDTGLPAPLPARSAGRLRIVNVGTLVPVKRPAHFLALAEELHRLGRLDEARWVGPGDVARWTEEARARELADVVHFTGPDDAVRRHLDAAHLLVMTSSQEGLPLVALETLAAGRGVVLPDVGSCRDVFFSAPPSGLLYSPDEDPAALADRLADLSDAVLQQWSDAARRRWEQAYTLERAAAEIRQLYVEVVAR